MTTMVIQCRKCENVLGINETEWRKLNYLNCPECGEESESNWIIIGESKDKAPHNIDKLIIEQNKED